MISVAVLVNVRGREVPLEQVRDPALVNAFRQLAADVGKKLAKVKCSVHNQGPTHVRMHVDAKGSVDLRYESCCTVLRDRVGALL
jgi:hypothetical protein